MDGALIDIAHTVFVRASIAIDSLHGIDKATLLKACRLLSSAQRVVVMGVGKSGHIGKKIAATMASTGTMAFFVHPTEALHGDLGMIGAHDVVLCLSKSGQSDELRTLLPVLIGRGISVVSITQAGGFLAKMATVDLRLNDFLEGCPLSLAPTSSTTATLVLGDALAMMLMHAKNFSADDFARFHPAGKLGKRLSVRVRDIMHSLPSVAPNASLSDTLLTMSQGKLGMVAVLDDGLCAIITDGDVRRFVQAHAHTPSFIHTHACDIMHTNPKTIDANSLATVGQEIMQAHAINQLIVLDDGMAVGVLSLHDILGAGL